MAAFNAPFLWIKIVGSVAKIVGKTNGVAAVQKGNNVFGSSCRKHDGFVAQIFYCCVVVYFYISKGTSVAIYRECQTVVGYYFLAFRSALLYSVCHNFQLLVGFCHKFLCIWLKVCACSTFLYNSHEQAFALRKARNEPINREWFACFQRISNKRTRYIPSLFCWNF